MYNKVNTKVNNVENKKFWCVYSNSNKLIQHRSTKFGGKNWRRWQKNT